MISLSGLCRDEFLCFIQPIHAILFLFILFFWLYLNIKHSPYIRSSSPCEFLWFYYILLPLFKYILAFLAFIRPRQGRKFRKTGRKTLIKWPQRRVEPMTLLYGRWIPALPRELEHLWLAHIFICVLISWISISVSARACEYCGHWGINKVWLMRCPAKGGLSLTTGVFQFISFLSQPTS